MNSKFSLTSVLARTETKQSRRCERIQMDSVKLLCEQIKFSRAFHVLLWSVSKDGIPKEK